MERDPYEVALKMAEAAHAIGNYPVGAVLVVNGDIIRYSHNTFFSEGGCWVAHAEMNIFNNFSRQLVKLWRDKYMYEKKGAEYNVELYTNIEPCIMCAGTAIFHQVKKIGFSCRDPHGGVFEMLNAGIAKMAPFYRLKWPDIEDRGEINFELAQKSCQMMIEFAEKRLIKDWEELKKDFTEQLRYYENITHS